MSVHLDEVGAALVVTLDRPERRNAIDGETAAGLEAAVEQFESSEAAVLVLTGSGGNFCAGADLTALDTLAPRLADGRAPLGPTHTRPSKPVIAAIDGWCVAGGLELALWADIRIASHRARFGCLERRWGVPLVDGGTYRLPRLIGLGRALDLILTGRVVEADAALAIGLVEYLAPDPLGAALDLADQLAGFPQPTLRSDLRSVYDGLGLDEAAALAREAELGREVLAVGAAGAALFMSGRRQGGAGRGGVEAADERDT
ncbi:MAG: enoyl-CoA hydratase [Frankiales bacterium]|nr:enoyl-CoA hydratase [Frankiales bacterium]